jgi:Xaa-Pro aminopeptidase
MRLAKLRARFDELGVDALLVTQPQNRRYLSGFTGSAGTLLISRATAVLMTDSRYWEQAGMQAPAFELFRSTKLFNDHLAEFLEQGGHPRRVGVESAAMTIEQYDSIKSVEGIEAEWVLTRKAVEDIRAVKDAEELEKMRKAVALGDDGFNYLCSVLRPGMTEREAAWELEVYLRTHGADALSFDPIIASGPNGAMAHHRPGDRVIQRGEPIVIDMGVMIDGYCSDLTRTISLGNSNAKFAEVYEVVRRAQQAALDGIHAGMSGVDADALARKSIEGAGFGENFGHGLGHGVGLAVHEAPSAGRLSKDTLPDGATLTVEPGVYLPGWGGVRIEDLVVVGEKGVDVLSRAHKNPII